MVERPQRRGGEEVEFVVSDGQLLQLTFKPFQIAPSIYHLTFEALEGSAVDLCNLVVVELKRGEARQALEVACAQRRQKIVVQSQEIKRFQA